MLLRDGRRHSVEKVRELILTIKKNEKPEQLARLLAELSGLLMTAPGMYCARVRITSQFYMGMEHGMTAAFLYTSGEYADEFIQGLRWSGMEAESVHICPEKRTDFFRDLHRGGFEAVVLDKSHESLLLPLALIAEEPQREPNEVRNPDLMRSVCLYYQGCARRADIQVLEDQMCGELYKASFLLPETDRRTMTPPLVTDSHGGRYCPVFTDWVEMDKFDRKKRLGGRRLRFRDLKGCIGNCDGIVINPFGFGLKLDMEKLLRIEREKNRLRVVK